MAAVKINDLHKDELPWIIEYDESKCIQCGKCTAACSFGAIKPKVELRKSNSILEKNKPKKVLVIEQNISLDNYCTGCSMCEHVCPNGAIKPVRKRAK